MRIVATFGPPRASALLLARAKVEKSVVHATNSRASGASDRNADDPGSDRGEC